MHRTIPAAIPWNRLPDRRTIVSANDFRSLSLQSTQRQVFAVLHQCSRTQLIESPGTLSGTPASIGQDYPSGDPARTGQAIICPGIWYTLLSVYITVGTTSYSLPEGANRPSLSSGASSSRSFDSKRTASHHHREVASGDGNVVTDAGDDGFSLAPVQHTAMLKAEVSRDHVMTDM